MKEDVDSLRRCAIYVHCATVLQSCKGYRFASGRLAYVFTRTIAARLQRLSTLIEDIWRE